MIPSEGFQLEFLRKLQRIFDSGQFVATYKFALLQALASLSLELPDADNGELSLRPAQLAEKFLELYWDQARPFSGDEVLRASNGRQANIVTRLAAARHRHSTLAAFRRSADWATFRQDTAQLVVRMPLWKLQTIGGATDDFLYPNQLVRGAIILRPGIAYCLRQFYPTVVQMVRSHWIQHLYSIPDNSRILGPQADLESFLFGSDRASLAAAAPVLLDLQHGNCFYCQRPLGNAPQVDHFIPWARYPRDLGHNFVLADARCNTDKSATLPARPHIERWMERNNIEGASLAAALGSSFSCDLPTTVQVARWSYECELSAGARLWASRQAYTSCDRSVLNALVIR